jgi:ubiquinol-cytochrome c reductase cytochrome b subunit
MTEPVPEPVSSTAGNPEDASMWTARIRRRVVDALPPDRMLPDRQPAYVASWIYVFGMVTISALVVVIVTGCILALKGPQWWHVSTVGHFVNSCHLWSVELFFFAMVVHLWGKFFMAAWRGNRAMTWIMGVFCFIASILTAFTGYVSQSNFDSQWISTQAKDGINATGGGAFFNVLNFGQMLMWHIALLPIAVVVLTVLHILLVRRHGVVPPLPAKGEHVPEMADEVAS